MSTIAVNAITDASGGSTASINGYTPTVSNMAGRNRIINGGFDVWQRGTSIAASSSNITYTADRFAARPNSSTSTTVTRSTDVPSGFNYSALVTRDSGQTGTLTRLQTALETVDMASFRGEVVTLSFYAKADSGFTPTSAALPVVLYVGDGTERLRAITAYDNQETPISTSVTLTTSWQRFTITSTALPSDLSQLSVAFEPAWVGTAPSNDGFYITGVQLEAGSVATPFEHRQYGQELALCQRYYWRVNQFEVICNGSAYTTSTFYTVLTHPTTMRAAPSVSYSSLSDLGLYSAGLLKTVTAVTNGNFGSSDKAEILFTSSSLSSGASGWVRCQNNSGAYMDFSAEL